MCSGSLPEGACNGALNSERRFIACCNYSLCTKEETFVPMYLAPTTTRSPLVTVDGIGGNSKGDTGAGVHVRVCVCECVCVCVCECEAEGVRERDGESHICACECVCTLNK